MRGWGSAHTPGRRVAAETSKMLAPHEQFMWCRRFLSCQSGYTAQERAAYSWQPLPRLGAASRLEASAKTTDRLLVGNNFPTMPMASGTATRKADRNPSLFLRCPSLFLRSPSFSTVDLRNPSIFSEIHRCFRSLADAQEIHAKSITFPSNSPFSIDRWNW